MAIDPDHVFRADAPGHLWNDGLDIDDHFPVEHRIGIARKLAPRLDGPLPHLTLRRVGSLTEIIESLLIRLDQTHLGAELDRKIADGKPPFDREVANGAAGIFHGVTSPARGADAADQREDEILGSHAEWQPALEHHAHCFGPALDDGLCCQHMRQLARPDTEGQRAQPAMRAGVAVATDDQAAGKAEAKFGSDDMDNALPEPRRYRTSRCQRPTSRSSGPLAVPVLSCSCRPARAPSRWHGPASRRSVPDYGR